MVLGGETTRVENTGESTRGETTRGKRLGAKRLVTLKKGQCSIKTWQYLKSHLSFLFFYFRCANKQTKKQTN